MPPLCTACHHESREALDAALSLGQASLGDLAARFGVTRHALARHRERHLSPALARVAMEREEAGARSAMARLETLYGKANRVLELAEQEGKASLSLSAIRELRGLVELLAKLTGELDERPQVAVVNLATSPEWVQLRGRLVAALQPYPEARAAVGRELAALEAGGSS